MTDGLDDLRAAAAVRRDARRRLADATAEHGQRSPLRAPHRDTYAEATEEWALLIRAACAAGHPIADIARAAGVAASSVHYRLQQAATASSAGSEASTRGE